MIFDPQAYGDDLSDIISSMVSPKNAAAFDEANGFNFNG